MSDGDDTGEEGLSFEAFTRRLLEARATLERFARKRANTWPLADELVQATCERALSKRHLYREDQDLLAWL